MTETLTLYQQRYPRIATLLEDLYRRSTWEQYIRGIREVEEEKRDRFSRLEHLILDVIREDIPEGASTAIAALLHRCKTMPKSTTAVESKVVAKPASLAKPPVNAVLLGSYDWNKPVPEGFPDVMKGQLQKFIEMGSKANQSKTMVSFHRENHEALGMEANSIAAFKTMVDKWQKGEGYRRDYFRYGNLDWTKPRSKTPQVVSFFDKLQNLNCPAEMKLSDIYRQFFQEDLTLSAFTSRIRDWQYPEQKKERQVPKGDRRDNLIAFMLKAQKQGKKRTEAVYEYSRTTGEGTDTVAKHERMLRREGLIPDWKKKREG